MESRFFNNLLNYISNDDRFNQELAEAKDEFQSVAGPIMETDREYTARMNSFHNWYILDRPMRALSITPLDYFLEFNANSLSADELEGYRELRENVHSIFELLRRTRNHTWVQDLLTRRKFAVEGSEETDHIDPGALFNTRLFTHQSKNYFTNFLVPHPDSVSKAIKAQARKVRKHNGDPSAFVLQLVLYQSRWDQYRQMNPRNIYRFEA